MSVKFRIWWGYLTCPPVISNVGYDDLSSPWDGKVFNDISGPAEDFGRQWYNFIASRLAEKMWDNSVVTHSLLIVGSVYVQPGIQFADAR